MSGFDNAAVDAAFFPGGQVKSNVLINIGYGDAEKLFPRSPRSDDGPAPALAVRSKCDEIWQTHRSAAGADRWIFTCPALGLLLAAG
jgi:hypothetical protein